MSRKPLHGPHFSKAFTWSPGQRKLTYWDKEELGELRRKKGLVLIFKHPFLPKQVSRTIFPPIRVLILTPEIYGHCIFGFVCGFATLSSEPMGTVKSMGTVYLVLFVALLHCPRSLTFSMMFFEAAGGNSQHCISGHLL